MGNFDRFEKLDMLGGIDEKYIKEAEKYLTKPLAADSTSGADISPDGVISLSPQPKKLSWKPFAVLAACAAVLIGGTAVLANYLNSRTVTPPVFNTSDSYGESGNSHSEYSEDSSPITPTDDYLKEMKALFGAQGNVYYARNRLNIKSYDLPEEIKLSDSENGAPVLADKDHLIFVNTNTDGQDELVEYTLSTGLYRTLHGIADDPNAREGNVFDIREILYADRYYVVFRCAVYDGTVMDKTELRVLERGMNGEYKFPWYTAYDMTANAASIKDCLMIDEDLYFITDDPVVDPNDKTENFPIYRYTAGSGKAAERVNDGIDIHAYNKELYYRRNVWSGISWNRLSMSGWLNMVDDVTIGKCGIFDGGARNGGTIRNIVTGEVILGGGGMEEIRNEVLGDMLLLGDDENRALYNTSTGELLVFEKDDVIRTQNIPLSGFDGGVYGFSGGAGEPAALCVITERPADTRLEDFKNRYDVRDEIKVSHFDDGWEIREFELDGNDTANGFNGAMIDTRLRNGSAFLDERTMLTVRTLADGSPEIAAYDVFDKTFTTLFGKENEMSTNAVDDYRIWYNDGSTVIFSPMTGNNTFGDIYVLTVKDRTWFVISEEPGTTVSGAAIIGDTLYYVVVHGERAWYDGTLYSYDLRAKGDTEPVRVRDNVYNLYTVKDEIITSTLVGQTSPQEIDGTEVFHLSGGDFSSSGYSYPNTKDIFPVKNGGIFIDDDHMLTDNATGRKLFATPARMSGSAVSDSCIMFEREMIFDTENYELFTLEYSNDAARFGISKQGAEWFKCGEGFCVYNSTDGKGYVFKRRENAHIDNTSKPDANSRGDYRIQYIRDRYDLDIPIGFVKDSFYTAQYDLPEKINGKYAQYREDGVIDSERVIAELYSTVETDGIILGTPRTVDECGIYNFKTGDYERLYQGDDYNILVYADWNCFVFTTYGEIAEYPGEKHYSMYLMDFTATEGRPTTLICRDTDGIDLGVPPDMVLLNGKLYFDSIFDGDWRKMGALYCYDIETGQLEKIAEKGKDPAVYKDTIVYTTMDGTTTEIKSLDGTVEYVNGASGFWITESGIYKISYDMTTATNALTDEKLFVGDGNIYMNASCGRYIAFYDSHYSYDSKETYFVYDVENGRLLIYEENRAAGLNFDRFLTDSVGMAFTGYNYNPLNVETPTRISIITEK